MSSGSGRDFPEYVTDESQGEEGTLFLPASNNGDSWTLLPGGILIGLAGGVLAPLSVRLAGALITIGYGLTAFTLRGHPNRFARALRFGFAIAAVLGAVLLVAGMATPEAIRHAISAPGHRFTVFLSFAAMPWALGTLKLFYGLVSCLWRPKRRASVQAASGA